MPERTDVARSANGALVASHWEGPIPPASEMEVYEKLHKGSLEFFLTTLQKEMEDRRERQRIEHEAFDRRAKRGQWMAFALSVVAFSVAALCACVHESTIGVAAIGVTILGIVKALLGSRAAK